MSQPNLGPLWELPFVPFGSSSRMLATPARVLSAWFIQQGHLSDPDLDDDWPAFTDYLPDTDTPDNAVALFNTGTVLDGNEMRTGVDVRHPGVQIMIRGTDSEVPWKRGILLLTALEGILRTRLNVDGEDITIQSVKLESGPLRVGEEREGTKRRQLVSINYTTTMGLTG